MQPSLFEILDTHGHSIFYLILQEIVFIAHFLVIAILLSVRVDTLKPLIDSKNKCKTNRIQ